LKHAVASADPLKGDGGSNPHAQKGGSEDIPPAPPYPDSVGRRP